MPIDHETIRDAVARNYYLVAVDLPKDAERVLEEAIDAESNSEAATVLESMLENARQARAQGMALCQDNGVNEHYVRIGADVNLAAGVQLEEAIADGVRLATEKVPLRPSVVHPTTRDNDGDNTSVDVPIVHTEYVEDGDALEITTVATGFGSENQSRLAMLTPSAGVEGLKEFVVESIKEAGGKACPPYTVGVGIGGTFNEVANQAKRAGALRWCGTRHEDPEIAAIEEELKRRINETGIGPMGIGGDTTALAVHVNVTGTHIAGNPVAVKPMCHPRRRFTVRIENDNSYRFRDRFEDSDHDAARVIPGEELLA